MKFKVVLPYLLFGSLMLAPKGMGEFRDSENSSSLHAQQISTQNILNTQKQIDAKAQELCDTYIANVLQGQENIKHSKTSHSRAVAKEFPGAVIRWYCIYGQYTQWNRAVSELGDTLHLIPFEARHSCPEFRRQMKQKYSGPEYAGVLYNGKMFKSDKDYKNALSAFLVRNHVTDSTPDSVKQSIINKFAQNNFSAESLHPGAILIVQKSATPSNTHAIMYLGKGYMRNGVFVADPKGKVLYAGYNNESIDDIFSVFPTNRIFAVDMFELARYAYTQEFQKIQNMNYNEMYQYVYDVPQDLYALSPRHQDLKKMAQEKYFNKAKFEPPMQNVQTNYAGIQPFPKLSTFRKPQMVPYIRNLPKTR